MIHLRRSGGGEGDPGTTGHPVPECPGTVPGRPVPLESLTEGEGWLSAVAMVP